MRWTLLIFLTVSLACAGGDAPAPPPPGDEAPPPPNNEGPPPPAPVLATAEGGTYGQVMADYACMPCEPAADHLVSATATSTLQDSDRYAARNAFDGDPNTAWCEGADGLGVGEKLTITLDGKYMVDAAFVHGGYFKSEETLAKNARLKKVRVRYANVDQIVTLPDPTIPGTLHESYPGTWYDAARSAPAGMGISWGEEVTGRGLPGQRLRRPVHQWHGRVDPGPGGAVIPSCMALPWLFLLVTVAGATEGFHKDLFMDSGCDLTQREQLYAAEFLGLSYDVMLTEDEDVQYEVIVASED
ncbi:MAG: discoidin domain-containing protein, partial [Deltaproteobacteria bacterium]|nr:discoidin domain-containing protein [Deltaproteobacteria bacterium]